MRRRFLRGGLFLALLALGAVSASADPDDDSDWTSFVAPKPQPGDVLAPTTAEGGFGSPDRVRLDQQLRRGLVDQLCRQAQIPIDLSFGAGDFTGQSVGVKRSLQTDVDGQVALVDDEKLRASYAHTFARSLDAAGARTLNLTFGAAIEGHSMVVRRAGTARSCDEVKRLLDLRDIKTVLPLRAERIAAMAPGELWRIPFKLTYAEGVGATDTVSPSAGAGVTVTFGRSDSGAASLTLYRIAEDKTRFRFRIDHVVVWSKALGITETYPAAPFAANASSILVRFLQGEANHEIEHYYSAWLTYALGSSDGTKILLEYVVDPRDPEQAESLARVLRGDFQELVKLSAKMSTFQTRSTLADYLKLKEGDSAQLGPAAYSASDRYAAKTKTFSLGLPFFVSHNAAALFGDDKVNRYSGAEGEFRFFRADKTKTNAYFDAPFVGPQIKHNSQRDVEAVTFAPQGGAPGDPLLVYIRNEGYYRQSASAARSPIRDLNGVLRLAGARRGASSGRLLLPEDALVPPHPARAAAREDRPERADRKGSLSITLVFDQRAVRDILAAPASEVLRAFAATIDLPERPLAQWLAENGTLRADGRIDYDQRAARRAFPEDRAAPRGGGGPARDLAQLSRQAAGVLADLAAGRDAPDNASRAEALARLAGGKGKSGLAYEDILRVLVQLVDPMDISGDVVAHVSGMSKGVPGANAHLVLKTGRPEVPTLKEAGDAKARFAEPSVLTD